MSSPVKLLNRLALWLLRRSGFRLWDIWDSWQMVLADSTHKDADGLHRVLFDFLLQHRLAALLSQHSCDLIVDVGGHTGRFASKLRRSGYSGRILSVEPNPALVDELLQASQRDELWDVEPCAVSDGGGVCRLHVTGDSSFSSFAQPNEFSFKQFGELSAVRQVVDVPSRPLHEILDLHVERTGRAPTSLFVKSDTQGFDQEVIGSLGRWRSSVFGILVEVPVRPLYQDSAGFLESMSGYQKQGFTLVDCYPVSHADDGGVIELDCLFVVA